MDETSGPTLRDEILSILADGRLPLTRNVEWLFDHYERRTEAPA
ncbi:hypothetical protein [Pseudoruegeria sp. HB172150]|nr:hypothetical protein [Pseudoruegeria sp. HB172150]